MLKILSSPQRSNFLYFYSIQRPRYLLKKRDGNRIKKDKIKLNKFDEESKELLLNTARNYQKC